MIIDKSYRYRVLVFCECYPAFDNGRSTVIVPGAASLPAPVKKSVTTTDLARNVFPQLMREAGIEIIPIMFNWTALVRVLNRWKSEGVEVTFIEQMMREFAQHPEWCRRSRKPPWQVFVARREELATLVSYNLEEQP